MFSLLTSQKIRQSVERVLHVPGNYTGGILEMTIVIDCNMEPVRQKEIIEDLAKTLKSQSEVFRNVRLNLVNWISDSEIRNEVIPIPKLMLGYDYVHNVCKKHVEILFSNLKLFHARSKLVILVTPGTLDMEDEAAAKSAMKPFLEKKLIVLCEDANRLTELDSLNFRIVVDLHP